MLRVDDAKRKTGKKGKERESVCVFRGTFNNGGSRASPAHRLRITILTERMPGPASVARLLESLYVKKLREDRVSRLVARLVRSLVNRGGMKFIDPLNRIHRVDPKIPTPSSQRTK
jgi:hypothetical protein